MRWLAEHVDVDFDKNRQSFSLISGLCLHLLFDDTLNIIGCDDSMCMRCKSNGMKFSFKSHHREAERTKRKLPSNEYYTQKKFHPQKFPSK